MTAGSLAAGFVASGGALLVVAGLGKAYANARGHDDGGAVRRVLRLRRGQWRVLAVAVAAIECCAGAAVCVCAVAGVGAGTSTGIGTGIGTGPGLGLACAAMAALGAVFCALLAYVRVRRVPGGCGCLGWGTARPVTARAVVRAGMLACAGLLGLLMPSFPPNDSAYLSFYPGLVIGGAAFTVASTGIRPRTPRCHRPVWRPRAVAEAALADSGVFRSVAAAAGPFARAAYRRDGCADEFLFEPATGTGSRVVFRVSHGGNGLAVQARVLTNGSPVTS